MQHLTRISKEMYNLQAPPLMGRVKAAEKSAK
jgi:hypothetical protein